MATITPTQQAHGVAKIGFSTLRLHEEACDDDDDDDDDVDVMLSGMLVMQPCVVACTHSRELVNEAQAEASIIKIYWKKKMTTEISLSERWGVC